MRKLERMIKAERDNCSCDSGCRKCTVRATRLKRYCISEIPTCYWNLPFSTFTGNDRVKDSIRKVIKNIDAFYDRGMSINFVGGLGTGKTSLACSILKNAIVKDYSAHYTDMKTIANKLSFSSSEFAEYITKINEVDFLVIDEVDGRWVLQSEKSEKFFGSTIEYLLRTRYQNGLPTMICSNSTQLNEIFGEDFQDSLKSLFSKYSQTIVVHGKDKRRT
jgi:DNA replication protein DnaC